MSQTPLHPSPLKEGRRILGEKNANANLSPARTPTKQSLLNASSPKKLLPSPSFTAKKRTSSQVEAEDAQSRLLSHGQRAEARAAQDVPSGRSAVDRDSRVCSCCFYAALAASLLETSRVANIDIARIKVNFKVNINIRRDESRYGTASPSRPNSKPKRIRYRPIRSVITKAIHTRST